MEDEILIGLFDSLKNEVREDVGALKTEMGERFDRVEARLDRMEARLDKIAAGTHYVTRLADWSEKQDKFQEDALRRMNQFDDRLRKLEGRS